VPLRFDTDLLVLMGAALALLIGLGGFLWWRRRAVGREAAARDLCDVLDSYLDSLVAQPAPRFDAERLWDRLERARSLHRQHFPELYSEMLELTRVHGELTSALLD
jgi:LPXTG-motif cell wall-anchored protein